MKTKKAHERDGQRSLWIAFDCFQLTLPYNKYAEAQSSELRRLTSVAQLIGCDLFLPKCPVAFGYRRQLARRMSMPEAAVNEDCPSVGAICNIGRSGQIFVSYAEAKT
jgi:hypothetical protein